MKGRKKAFFLMESTNWLILFGPAFLLVLFARTGLESLIRENSTFCITNSAIILVLDRLIGVDFTKEKRDTWLRDKCISALNRDKYG